MDNNFIELENIDILEVAKPLKDKMSSLLSSIKDKLLVLPTFIKMIDQKQKK